VINITYKSLDYLNFIKTVSSKLNAPVNDNFIKLPAEIGNGYLRAQNFDNGISFIAMDVCFNEDVMLARLAAKNSLLTLRFQEALDHDKWPSDQHRSVAHLSNTALSSRAFYPKGCRVRSCGILFEKKHLLSIMENKVADNFLNLYFSKFFRDENNVSALNSDYRAIMDEIVQEEIMHPFRHLFFENRVMLLMEKFMLNFLKKERSQQGQVKLSEEEINRLIAVESMLVRDFSEPAPLIDTLSKLSAMSATKLKKDFKSLYGLPVYEYYQKNRMMHAKKLLLENKYTMAEVGYKVGYTNLGHFAASFKKEFNSLPKDINRTKDKLSNNS
jgi:AraC-like DNA-binding protein